MAQDWVAYVGLALTGVSILLFLSAALHDVIARTVPNGLVVALAIVGVVARFIDQSLLLGVAIGTVTFFAAVLCWRRGWMGGGDVKLLGAGAIAIPPLHILSFITVMAVSGAGLALIYLLGRTLPAPRRSRRPESFLARVARVERWRLHRGGPLPYACAIAMGGLLVLLRTGEIKWF